MSVRLRHLLRRSDAGATAVEYALMIGFIAAVIAATVTTFGQMVEGLFAGALPGLR